MAIDTVVSGRDHVAPLHRLSAWARRHLVALILVALTLVVLLAFDQWQQQRELDALLAAVEAGEAQIASADVPVGGIVDYYAPVLANSTASPGLRSSFATALSGVAQAGVTRLGAASDEVSSVHVLPWHTSLRAARQSYIDRLGAWRTHYTDLATDPDALFLPSDELDISALTSAAALREAVPWVGDLDDIARIDSALGG